MFPDACDASHASQRTEDRSAFEAADVTNNPTGGAPGIMGTDNASSSHTAEEKNYKWRWQDFGKHDGVRFKSQFLVVLRRIAAHKEKIFKHGCKGEGWELVISDLLSGGESRYDFSQLKVKTLKAKYKPLAHDMRCSLGPYIDMDASDGSDPPTADEWTNLWINIFKYEHKQLEASGAAPPKVFAHTRAYDAFPSNFFLRYIAHMCGECVHEASATTAAKRDHT